MSNLRYVWRTLLLCSLCLRSAASEDWTGWRGPRGDGSSSDNALPTIWDGTRGQNILWHAKLPGEGHSSPIVLGDRLFVTACLPETRDRVLMQLDAKNGAIIWQRTVIQSELESIHALNSRASGTPASDGNWVYVAFMQTDGRLIAAPNVGSERDITAGEMIAAAYDFEGELKWRVVVGPFISAHGFSTSPVIYEDLVILNGDHDGASYLVALEKETGRERWRIPREHGIRSYVTPLIRHTAGKTQLVFSGSKQIVSLDPANGQTHWKVNGPTEQFVASMVFDGSRFYMNCGYPDYFVVALRPDGHGDVTDMAIAWQSTQARSYVPSPVVLNGYLIVADDRGTVNCYETETGERLWLTRLGSGYNASLVHANGLVYLTAMDGETTVIKPGREAEIVARNPLGEPVSASAALANGHIYLRGEHTLFCVGAP